MQKISFIAIFLLLSLVGYTQDGKQKIGHLNTGNLMTLMPEIKEADKALTVFQDSLQAIETEMIEIFEKEYTEFVQQANAGELTKIAIQRKQNELQEKEQEIIELRKEIQIKIMQKRQELMNPLLDRLQTAVNDVAKENGFHYIMDVGSGALLYASDSENIESLVRKKLGIVD